jgi:S-methyl-5-thioribose-1-phosphate isomerase
MTVRGAPFIAIVGLFSIAYDMKRNPNQDLVVLVDKIVSSRPTAVNIKTACDKLLRHNGDIMEFANNYYNADIVKNKKITENIMPELTKLFQVKGKLNVMTHCNTGSLATAGWGTALGVVRGLLERDMLNCCYFTETRPWNQGSRLTATECMIDQIPHTMIADTAVSAFMPNIDFVIVGADKILPNGNVANKIGTNNLAIIAHHYSKPFYVAADTDTFAETNDIVIEDRHNEGFENIPDGLVIKNPGFDITNKYLITGYVSEQKLILNKNHLSDCQIYGMPKST